VLEEKRCGGEERGGEMIDESAAARTDEESIESELPPVLEEERVDSGIEMWRLCLTVPAEDASALIEGESLKSESGC
jgi:hypothetical protein